jgi:hypothetical protein
LAFVQGVLTIHNSVKCRRNGICGAGSSGNHYQKSHHKNVVFTTNQNHKVTCNVLYKGDEPSHLDGYHERIHAKGRL